MYQRPKADRGKKGGSNGDGTVRGGRPRGLAGNGTNKLDLGISSWGKGKQWQKADFRGMGDGEMREREKRDRKQRRDKGLAPLWTP